MDQQTIDTYNALAKEYDEETADFWKLFPDTILNSFADSISGGKKVLNLGSGPGRDGLLLQARGVDVTCLDASSAMVQMCTDRGLKAVEGNLLSTPFEDREFDGVWAYTSLLHIKKSDLPKALAEIRRVLQDGGILGLGMIAGDGELYRESSGVGLPRWFALYTKDELETILQHHGFDVTYFESYKPRSKLYLNYIARKV